MSLGKEVISKMLARSRKVITSIFIIQIAFILLTFIALFAINVFYSNLFILQMRVIINASLFGFCGCLIYFSRKSYVYLITNKFMKILDDKKEMDEDINEDIINNIIRGYYLYISLRPFVGLIIGPLIYMLVLTGLITFMKTAVPVDVELSRSGRYFIYFLSFISGHALSDILDYFSKLAKKIAVKSE